MQRSGRCVEVGGPMLRLADGSIGLPAVGELFEDLQMTDVQIDGAP